MSFRVNMLGCKICAGTKDMAGEGDIGNRLPSNIRERLERIVVEIVGIASECEDYPANQYKLMQLADQISTMLDERQ
jgi:hypothetical protein